MPSQQGQIRATEPVPLSFEWGEAFGDPVVAAAILDRLMHNAVVFNIKGPSWRMREHHALEQAATDPDRDSGRRRR